MADRIKNIFLGLGASSVSLTVIELMFRERSPFLVIRKLNRDDDNRDDFRSIRSLAVKSPGAAVTPERFIEGA